MQEFSLSNIGMQDTLWKMYRTDDPYVHEKKDIVPLLKRRCYELVYNDRVVTMGVYEYNSIEIFKAWGYKDDIHCSYYATKLGGVWSEPIEGCPDFKIVLDVNGAIDGFSLTLTKIHIWENGLYFEKEISLKGVSNTESKVCSVK